MMGKIDWDAARARMEIAGEALDIPREEIDRLKGLSDHRLNNEPELIDFCAKHEINIDWLVIGKMRGVLRESVRLRRQEETSSKPTEADPMFAAIAEHRKIWDTAYGPDEIELDEESEAYAAREQAIFEAKKRVCETRATTLEGLVAQMVFSFDVFGGALAGRNWSDNPITTISAVGPVTLTAASSATCSPRRRCWRGPAGSKPTRMPGMAPRTRRSRLAIGRRRE